MKVRGHEVSAERPGSHGVISKHVVFSCFMKSREMRTLRTKMSIVSLFPAIHAVALVKALDGHQGLRSQVLLFRQSHEI